MHQIYGDICDCFQLLLYSHLYFFFITLPQCCPRFTDSDAGSEAVIIVQPGAAMQQPIYVVGQVQQQQQQPVYIVQAQVQQQPPVQGFVVTANPISNTQVM